MSDVPGAAPGQGQEPSEEEVRAYLSQLRAAPAAQVIAEVISALLNAAQVKLGRRDGRLLLDLTASTVDGAREHLPAELLEQVDGVLSQLRVAQVEAEGEVGEAVAQGQVEPNDLGSGGAADAAGLGGAPGGAVHPGGQAPPAGGGQRPPEEPPSGGSRLWVPGR